MTAGDIEAAFAPGQRVRVKTGDPPGHIRTPHFLRGKAGVIDRIQGAYRNPEDLAYGGEGLPKRPLYLVRFSQKDLWDAYDGPEGDAVAADIYEHWLEPLDDRGPP